MFVNLAGTFFNLGLVRECRMNFDDNTVTLIYGQADEKKLTQAESADLAAFFMNAPSATVEAEA